MTPEKESTQINVEQQYKSSHYFQITSADHICHACWELASYSHSSKNIQRRCVGHQIVCVVCGRSIHKELDDAGI